MLRLCHTARGFALLCSASAMLPAALPVRSTGQGCYAAAMFSLALLRRCEGPKRVALPLRCSADRCCAVPARLYAIRAYQRLRHAVSAELCLRRAGRIGS